MKTYVDKMLDSFITVAPLLVAVFWVAYIFEPVPLWYPNEPFPLESNTVQQGQTIQFELERCSNRVVNYEFSQRFQRLDKEVPEVYINSGNATAQKGCSTYWSQPKIVPGTLPAGTYRMLFDVTAEGRLRDHTFIVRTQKFDVIAK